MTEKKAIEILKDMNDGYTFQACRICVSDNKFNEKQGICESKTCEYLNAIETVIQALEQRINNQKIFAKEYEKISKQLNCEVKDNLEKSIALEQKDKEIAELRIKQISSNLNKYIKQKQKEDEQLYALNEGWKIELEKKDKEISELKEKLER